MVACFKCSKSVDNEKEIAVCADCKASFHFGCLRADILDNYKKLTIKRKAGWKCDSCSQETSSTASKSDPETNSLLDYLQSMRKDLKAQINQVNANVQDVKSQIDGVNTTISDMQTSLSFLVTENSNRKTEMDNLLRKNIELKEEVDNLWLKVHDFEQYSRRDNVEISGIPFSKGENVYALLEKLAQAMELNFNSNFLSTAHRLPGRKDDRRPPLVVARFISRECRAAWMRAAWFHRRSLTARSLQDTWAETPIYINDHLTPHYKAIFYEARKLVREKKISSAWSWDSKVFVRVSADRSVPPVQLKTLEDLRRLQLTFKN